MSTVAGRSASRTIVAAFGAAALAAGASAQQVDPDMPAVLRQRAVRQPEVIVPMPPPEGGMFPSRDELAETEIPAALDELAARLDDPDYTKREAATRSLVEGDFDLIELYALLDQRPLSGEQRYRVLAAIWERLLESPHGALGITLGFQPGDLPGEPGEVIVRDLLPGLPAEHVLQRGDFITRIDGAELYAQSDLVLRVQMKRPGDAVQLTVKRPLRDAEGKPLTDRTGQIRFDTRTIDIELGSAELLARFDDGRSQGRIDMERRRQAQRAAAYYAPRPKQIELTG